MPWTPQQLELFERTAQLDLAPLLAGCGSPGRGREFKCKFTNWS
jgi:hypothetical protein